MGIGRVVRAGAMALMLVGGAVAQEEFTTGWYLETFETGGGSDLFLYWYDAEAGAHTLQFNCQEGFADFVISAFLDPLPTGPETFAVVGGDAGRVEMEAISGTVGDRYSTGGITTLTPELVDILSGQFSVEADGDAIGRFSSKGAGEKFAEMAAACSG
jgi:hypothetical protein